MYRLVDIIGLLVVFVGTAYPDLPTTGSQHSECSITKDVIVCQNDIRDIPDGVTKVKIQQLTNRTYSNINADLFKGRNWDTIGRLTLSLGDGAKIFSNAFCNLKKLLYLEITNGLRWLEGGGYSGLDNVRTLVVNQCSELLFGDVITALDGMEKMPKLENITLTYADLKHDIIINETVINVLSSKNISFIDLSGTNIYKFDFQALCNSSLCQRLLQLKCSQCNFKQMGRNVFGRCNSLRKVDVSYSRFNEGVPSLPKNVLIPFGPNFFFINLFSHLDTIVCDGCVHDYDVDIRNITLVFTQTDTMTIRHLSIANNRLKYVDVKLLNFPKSLELLNLSSNGLHYMQPDFLFKNNSLTTLDLSHNELFKMSATNSSDFGNLLRVYKNLRIVYLVDNFLSYLPKNMFGNTQKLNTIDLSHNTFKQVDFYLDTTTELEYLNLAYNQISQLSESSMKILQQHVDKKTFQVDLRNNPIDCSSCECKDFIEWIVNAENAVITDNTCRQSDGRVGAINGNMLQHLEYLCQRKTRILTATIIPFAFVLLLLITVFVIRKYWKRNNRKKIRIETLRSIREGRHKLGFIAFLAFSGEDEHFVQEHIREPLGRHLRTMMTLDQELICTGDRHFQLGCTIGGQMNACCNNCGSVILVVSSAFCKSPHCLNEMSIAYTNRKPIVLMFKERVEESQMPPLLGVIFRQFTRVTWEVKDGEYTMSTSWENVCESLIDCRGNIS